jgi:hypothetical protein
VKAGLFAHVFAQAVRAEREPAAEKGGLAAPSPVLFSTLYISVDDLQLQCFAEVVLDPILFGDVERSFECPFEFVVSGVGRHRIGGLLALL